MLKSHHLVLALLLTACALSSPPTPAPTSQPTERPQSSVVPTAFAPGPADTETPAAIETAGTATGQQTGFHGLVVPQDWFHTTIDTGEIQALVFTPLDPAALAVFDDPEWMVPPDYAIGALVRSPLPEGVDPAALQAGLAAAAADLDDEGLLSLLSGAEQIGLIDLAALDSAALMAAAVTELGGRPALEAQGTAGFGPGTKPELAIRVLLAWTDDAFFTFYAIAAEEAWDSNWPSFQAAMKTIELP